MASEGIPTRMARTASVTTSSAVRPMQNTCMVTAVRFSSGSVIGKRPIQASGEYGTAPECRADPAVREGGVSDRLRAAILGLPMNQAQRLLDRLGARAHAENHASSRP